MIMEHELPGIYNNNRNNFSCQVFVYYTIYTGDIENKTREKRTRQCNPVVRVICINPTGLESN